MMDRAKLERAVRIMTGQEAGEAGTTIGVAGGRYVADKVRGAFTYDRAFAIVKEALPALLNLAKTADEMRTMMVTRDSWTMADEDRVFMAIFKALALLDEAKAPRVD